MCSLLRSENHVHSTQSLWGVGLRSRASCVAVWYLTPFWGYFILPPRCLVDVTPRIRKAPKELYERRQLQIEDEAVLFYFPLFPGFNNHSMGEGFFPEYNWNSWLPTQGVLKYVNRFLVYACPHLVFLSFNMVLVAFGSLSKSSVLVCSVIGPFRSFCILAYC